MFRHSQGAGAAREFPFPAFFVLALWGVMTALGVLYLVRYASPVPYVDAWADAIPASADAPDVAWLVKSHNGHRFPLVRLLAWGAYHVWGDMRALLYLSVLLASATSLGCVLAARRIRGKCAYVDAVFPLILLHGFHSVNFLWSVQLFFVAAGCLACACMIYLMTPPSRHGIWGALGAGLALVLLPMNGAMGLAFAPLLGLGIFAHGVVELRNPGGKSGENPGKSWNFTFPAVCNLLAPVLAAVLCVLYVTCDFHVDGTGGASLEHFSLVRVFITTVQCASVGLGAAGNRAPELLGIALLAVCAGTSLTLGALTRKKALTRAEFANFGLVRLAGWMVPLAIGFGRSVAGGGAPRYGILAAPLVCAILLVWCEIEKRGFPQFAKFVQMAFFTWFCAFFMYHVSMALEFGKERTARTQAFLADIESGMPLDAVAGRQWTYWCWDEAPMRTYLALIRENGVEPFTAVNPAELRVTGEIPTPGNPLHGDGGDGVWLVLPEARHVDALRFHFTLTSSSPLSDTRVVWEDLDKLGELTNVCCQQNRIKMGTGSRCRELTVWVNAEIRGVELRPDVVPWELTLDRVEILAMQ